MSWSVRFAKIQLKIKRHPSTKGNNDLTSTDKLDSLFIIKALFQSVQ